MDNVYSYLKWRGDLDLSVVAFNEVDSLILSLISYVDFDEIVPGIDKDETITLKEASVRFWKTHGAIDKTVAKTFLGKPPILLKQAADYGRFGEIKLGKHISHIDYERDKQFSATAFFLPDGSTYIAFRGTDLTMVGWKEDFSMSFKSEVPSQLDAAQYLQDHFCDSMDSLRLGGHSKGGNLAIYSGVKCKKSIRDRIISVHNFDGPGVTDEILQSEEYMELLPRITRYIPQASIIGMMMGHKGKRKIIKSNRYKGIMQHDCFCWVVGPQEFSCLEVLDKSSILMDRIIKEWVSKLDVEQREQFIDVLFGFFSGVGIENATDFFDVSIRGIRKFIKNIKDMPIESKTVLTDTMNRFFIESRKVIKREFVGYVRLPRGER